MSDNNRFAWTHNQAVNVFLYYRLDTFKIEGRVNTEIIGPSFSDTEFGVEYVALGPRLEPIGRFLSMVHAKTAVEHHVCGDQNRVHGGWYQGSLGGPRSSYKS